MILKALIFFFIQFVFLIFFSEDFLYAIFLNIIFTAFAYLFLFFIKRKKLFLFMMYFFVINILLDSGGLNMFYYNTKSVINFNPFNQSDNCSKTYCSQENVDDTYYKDYKITDGYSDRNSDLNYIISRKIFDFNNSFLIIKYTALFIIFTILGILKNRIKYFLYYFISTLIITFEFIFCYAMYVILKSDKFIGPYFSFLNYILINIILFVLSISIGRMFKNEVKEKETNTILFLGFLGAMYSLILISFNYLSGVWSG